MYWTSVDTPHDTETCEKFVLSKLIPKGFSRLVFSPLEIITNDSRVLSPTPGNIDSYTDGGKKLIPSTIRMAREADCLVSK